jgi:hypothetical protein
VDGQVVPTHVEVPPLVLAPLANKERQGAKASRKTGVPRDACSGCVRSHS